MSYVTNAVLLFDVGSSGDNETFLEKVNEWPGHATAGGFRSVDDTDILPPAWYGGSKVLECEVAVAAFNYLDEDMLIEHLKRITQHDDGTFVQLWLKDQDGDEGKLYVIYPNFETEIEDHLVHMKAAAEAEDWDAAATYMKQALDFVGAYTVDVRMSSFAEKIVELFESME